MKKIKVECLECQEKSMYCKGMTHIKILPTVWIKLKYGSIDNFIEEEKEYGSTFKKYKIIQSSDYDDRFEKYLNVENDKILKCIEEIKSSNLTNVNEIVKYLEGVI